MKMKTKSGIKIAAIPKDTAKPLITTNTVLRKCYL